jgi:alpha-mannosidase
MAEDSDDLIVRLYESEGKKTEAKVEIREVEFTTSIKPFELKTLKVAKDGKVTETDLLER